MSLQWQGVFPAIITPFSSDDEVDLSMFRKNLDAQIAAGIDGVIIGGTLGEASVLTTSEKENLVRLAKENVKREPGDYC